MPNVTFSISYSRSDVTGSLKNLSLVKTYTRCLLLLKCVDLMAMSSCMYHTCEAFCIKVFAIGVKEWQSTLENSVPLGENQEMRGLCV